MRAVALCLLASCIDVTKPVFVQPTIDAFAGRVISTFPRDGESGVVNEGEVTIFFSKPMLTNSVTVTSEPPITFADGAWDQGDQRVRLRIVGALQDGVLYTAAIDGVDTDGVAVPTHAFSFTTATPVMLASPQVTATQPALDATNVPLTQAIVVTFSKVIASASLALSPDATVTESWDAAHSTVTFTPNAPLAETQSYVATIDAVDTDGLTVSAALAFTTLTLPDTTAPTIVSRSPSSGATGVPTNSSVSIGFSEPMQPSSLFLGLFGPSGGAIPCAMVTSDSVVTCTPSALLPDTSLITATLTAGAQDRAGNALSGTLTHTFTTGATPDTTAPVLVSVAPATGSNGIEPGASLSFSFSEPMDQAATAGALTVLRNGFHLTGVVTWTSSSSFVFNPGSDFFFGDVASWSFAASARDLGGNALGGTKSGTFNVMRRTGVTLASSATLDGEISSEYVQTNAVHRVGDYFDDMLDEARDMRIYVTFDLAGLTAGLGAIDESRVRITGAAFVMTLTECSGQPLALAPLLAEGVVYGPTLERADYTCATQPFVYNQITPATFSPGTKTFGNGFPNNVADKVAFDWMNRAVQQKRSQWRVRFETYGDGDENPDNCSFRSGASTITAERPRLTVTFEFP